MAKVKLSNVRLSFPDLFDATDFNGDGNFKYRATFLIEPGSANFKAIQAAIDEAGAAKFTPAKWPAIKKAIQHQTNKFCFQDGAVKPDYDGYDGKWYITASKRVKDGRPLVIDRDKTPLTAADGKPYSGCYVNATIDVFGYTNSGNGISAGLGGVQFVKDGDAFGAAAPAKPEDFPDLGDTGEDDDNSMM